MVKTQITVGVSDAKVSNEPSDIIVTHALGSCIGVCLYDSRTQIGGMLHYLLPNSAENPKQATQKPFMYADTGMKMLIEKMEEMGANKKRLQVKIAGGANTLLDGSQNFNIGKRNYLAIRKILWKNEMFIDGEDINGSVPRTLYLDIGTGTVIVRSEGIEKVL